MHFRTSPFVLLLEYGILDIVDELWYFVAGDAVALWLGSCTENGIVVIEDELLAGDAAPVLFGRLTGTAIDVGTFFMFVC